MYLEVFIVGVLAGMSPGPDFVVVMRNSLSFGARVGSATAIGIAMALTIHVAYTVLGFALILEKAPAVFKGIQIMGAAYLFWLGLKAIRSGPPVEEGDEPDNSTTSSQSTDMWMGFRNGFICNMLNPKATLFFLSIFSQFLSSADSSWMRWIYGLEVIIAVGSWFLLLSFIITSRFFRRFYRQWSYWIDRLLGAVLLYFGLRIVVSVGSSLL